MSVNYSAVFGVGVEFETTEEARDWLSTKGFECTDEQINYHGFEDAYEILPDGVIIECLNCYTGEGWAVYAPIYVWEIKTLAERFTNAVNKWREAFGEEPETIHTVRVY